MPSPLSCPNRARAAVLAPVLLLAACSAPEGGSGTPDAAETIENCGHEVPVGDPPERVVSLNQGTTEILYALGLQDRVVGTATWTDPLPEELEAADEGVPRLAENAPSFEKVLESEPDFVAASFVSTLGPGGVAERDRFDELGVPTYVSPADCGAGKDNDSGGDGSRTEPLELDDVYGEIRDLAAVFGVQERGGELVAELEGRVAAAADEADASGVSLMYWFANSESPYLAGCCGAPGAITRALGADNAFDDTTDEWPQINWETVADRDPEVIVLGDLTRNSETAESAAAKIDFLESNAATRDLTAVREERYILLSGQAMNPSYRTVEGVEQVAEGLRGLDAGK
ncbi:ABC transporter substrate-binding protein [Nocardiopsis coralliicola]